MISEASRYATKYTKRYPNIRKDWGNSYYKNCLIREIQNSGIADAGITRGLGLYIIKQEGNSELQKEYRLDVEALLTFLCKKVKLSDLENIPVKWGYPRLTYDQTLKILERK